MPSLKKLPRDTLNDKAAKLGIAEADQLSTRADVIRAIEAAKSAQDAGLWGRGVYVASVFAKGKRVLVDMSADLARQHFGEVPLHEAASTSVVDATEKQLAGIRERNADVADSALAAAALRMAYELDHPYNSATAKSYCIKELRQSMDRLLELAPAGEGEKGALDELKARRRAQRKSAA